MALPPVVDIDVPFIQVDPSRWHPERPMLLMCRSIFARDRVRRRVDGSGVAGGGHVAGGVGGFAHPL